MRARTWKLFWPMWLSCCCNWCWPVVPTAEEDGNVQILFLQEHWSRSWTEGSDLLSSPHCRLQAPVDWHIAAGAPHWYTVLQHTEQLMWNSGGCAVWKWCFCHFHWKVQNLLGRRNVLCSSTRGGHLHQEELDAVHSSLLNSCWWWSICYQVVTSTCWSSLSLFSSLSTRMSSLPQLSGCFTPFLCTNSPLEMCKSSKIKKPIYLNVSYTRCFFIVSLLHLSLTQQQSVSWQIYMTDFYLLKLSPPGVWSVSFLQGHIIASRWCWKTNICLKEAEKHMEIHIDILIYSNVCISVTGIKLIQNDRKLSEWKLMLPGLGC